MSDMKQRTVEENVRELERTLNKMEAVSNQIMSHLVGNFGNDESRKEPENLLGHLEELNYQARDVKDTLYEIKGVLIMEEQEHPMALSPE